jgi:CheY-like chemotaxis protein/HPt (histidine-containing phosphotransfer) domain-containing protein
MAQIVKPVKRARLLDTLRAVVRGEDAFERRALMEAGAHTQKTAGIEPLRILLAEDNVVNQRVALTMLRKLGQTATVAANGQEVLELAARQPFDVILMDCQMPELDGYEATHRIRLEEADGAYGRRVPHFIVALTANAMVGDRERCLQAGMDDFVTKPIEMAALEASLRRAVAFQQAALGLPPSTEGPESSHTLSPDSELGALPVLDDAALQMLAVPGEPEALRELASLFQQDAARRIESIRIAVRHRDSRAASAHAHALKGSAGNLGGRRLATLLARLEASAKAGEWSAADNDADRLPVLCAEFEKAMNDHIQ